MTQLPRITITPALGGGWVGVCSCGFRVWDANRPAVDHAAIEHRRVCAKRRRD